MEDGLESLTGTWTARLTKDNSSFCVDRVLCFDTLSLPPSVKTERGKAWVFVTGSELPSLNSVPVRYFGNWVQNQKYGIQFKAVGFEIKKPNSITGIENYLRSPLFRGIGKAKAEALTRALGTDTLKAIEREDQRVKDIVGPLTALELSLIVKNTSLYSEVFDLLGIIGISSQAVLKIIDRFGGNSMNVIQLSPYRLQECNINFATCDKIALYQGYALDSYERVQGALIYKTKELENLNGDTFFDSSVIKNETFKFLNQTKKSISKEKFEELFQRVVKNHEGIISRKFPTGEYILTTQMEVAEYESSRRILSLLKTNVSTKKIEEVKRTLESYCSSSTLHLSEKQKEAVVRSLSSHISVITGGPGTGKTTITQAIIAVYERVFRGPIHLMAPTGKAARRMSEATSHDASTIHSKLGLYEWYKEEEQKPEPITNGLVIIDEASMVDQILMKKVMESIKSDDCHVLFVGDVDQLPSVGPGCVLRSLIEAQAIPTTKLTEIFRQKDGSSIVMNAIRINFGKTETIEFNDNDFVFIEANSEEEAKKKISEVYEKEISRVGVDNVALLCPLRRTKEGKYICSSDGLNPILQDIVNPKDNYSEAYKMSNGIEFRINDRVLQWKNNKTSFNGDIGIIQDIYFDGQPMFQISWDNGNVVEVPLEDMNSIELGYSMSIHKSQGSEYASVIIPMLKDQMRLPLYKRNLIYTGVTRAKERVYIVGSKEAFNKAVIDNDCSKRRSFLANRILANSDRSK